MEKLSIVTITFRDPDGLRSTIESLKGLADSGIPFEHIIVDSSPEISQVVLSTLPENWPIVHRSEPANGIYSALNTGLNLASGSYVWFLNSGDRLKDTETLARALKAMEMDATIDLLYAGASLFRNGKYLYDKKPPVGILGSLLGQNQICQQAVLYRRKALLEVGPFNLEYRLAADYEHHWRYFILKKRAFYLSEILVCYDMSGSSANYRQVFAEFKKIHRDLASQLPLTIRIFNEILRFRGWVEIVLLKSISESAFGDLLRPFWRAWKRL